MHALAQLCTLYKENKHGKLQKSFNLNCKLLTDKIHCHVSFRNSGKPGLFDLLVSPYNKNVLSETCQE